MPTLVTDPALAWRTALALLTEREGAVLTLRHGPFGGPRLTFADVASKLRITRQRAHQLHHRAIEVLWQRDATRESADALAGRAESMEVKGNDRSAAEPVAVEGAPSKRDGAIAMKLVSEAGRELALAVEAWRHSGDDALVAALERALAVVAAHMREMQVERAPSAPCA